MPDPLAPPAAGTPLTPAQLKAARAAAAAAARGDERRAHKHAVKLPATHPVAALIRLEAAYVAGKPVADEAAALALEQQGYAAAWSLAALAARAEGRIEEALGAGRRARDLRPDGANATLVADLERGLVAAGISEATSQLARGEATVALERALRLLELVPETDAARILAVRAALAAGKTDKAAELLPALPDTPEGLVLKGKVAESLGQWELAAVLYERLPSAHHGRCELLAGAREQLRLSLAPPYLAQAIASPALSRRGLAAVLAFTSPSLAERASGNVPVFEDIVGLPEARDIVVSVRAGVLTGDAIARRFGPDRTVSQRELVASLERLARVLGRPAPLWCGESKPASNCVQRPATLDGRTVAGLIRLVAGQEDSPCIPR